MRKGSVRSWLRGFSTFLFVCIGAPALADVPAFINTEGLIVDEDGIPMDGVVDLAFAIYDVPEGGDSGSMCDETGCVAATSARGSRARTRTTA